ncbi:MAG: QueT transporter family protein [Oscillospiraceae bacterium]|nr:QueT transporter family protein [Oscillospiraceae bacterium]
MKKTRKTTLLIVQAGVIAAVYAALTYFSSLFGLAYGGVQFRLSEALTILPVFTPAAIPGLAVGCIIANIISPNGILDMILGPTATLLAAIASRLLGRICFKGLPVLSLLPPVLFNALIIGGMLTYLGNTFTVTAFLPYAISVGAGQAVVCFGLGLPLAAALKKTGIFKAADSSRLVRADAKNQN